MDRLIYLVKRAIAYSSIGNDYSELKEEAKKAGISLYSLHTLVKNLMEKKVNNTNAYKTGFIRNDIYDEIMEDHKEQEAKETKPAPSNQDYNTRYFKMRDFLK